ncbi:hypothetical protein [Streptomyces sp. NPDC056255]|uniref:hypothetical protein n=1 Tax=Streptomyces sp. NPDC056255 TaxID=3345764 RepID=UPI0035DE0FDA
MQGKLCHLALTVLMSPRETRSRRIVCSFPGIAALVKAQVPIAAPQEETHMSWFEELPEGMTRSDLASVVGREARSVELMAARGLLADPACRNRGKCVWEEEAAQGWFRSLREHAVIVPVNDRALIELDRYGACLCPLSSSHVGLARPRLLVMYRPRWPGARL